MSATGPHPYPGDEFVAKTVLGLGLRRLYVQFAGQNRPLVRRRIPELGSDVFAELHMLMRGEMVLLVRDAGTGEVLAESVPDDFTAVDLQAPKAKQMFRDWFVARASSAGGSEVG